jgi:hypothetical protein
VSSAHLVVEGAVFYYTVSRALGVPSLGEQLRRLFVGYLVLDVVTYGAVLGACHALDFYTRLRDSSLRAARLELGLAQARMHALRAELNPHFFFNALNAISGLVRRHDDEAAVRMLARLGELLRVTLDHDLAPEIALDDELALLDRYLDIERRPPNDRRGLRRGGAPCARSVAPAPAAGGERDPPRRRAAAGARPRGRARGARGRRAPRDGDRHRRRPGA